MNNTSAGCPHTENPMKDYSFQFLDALGKLAEEQTLHADSDEEALELARLFGHLLAIRVLQGGREVGVVKGKSRR
jgi:hypothetical protein